MVKSESSQMISGLFDEKPVKSRVDREGKRIMERILHHDMDNGGVYVEVTGAQGAGKTSIMLGFMEQLTSFYPKEKVFWSSSYNAPLQFLKIGEKNLHKIKFYVMEGSNVTFHDRIDNGKKINLEVTTFTTLHDLYQKAEYGVCNAVFFGDRLKWMEFIQYLRSVYEWSHIFIDEFGEVAPSDQSGKMWKKVKEFSEVVKEIRKCDINLFTNSQSVTDIDYRVRKKIMIKIFLPGASADRQTRVTQKAIDNLHLDIVNGNFGYLEYSGKFGKARFRKIYKPPRNLSIEARTDGGMNNGN